MRRAVLELINEDQDGTRIVHGRLTDADAYDAWTGAEQLKEALEYRALMERGDFTPAELPRKEKTLLLAAMLLAMPDCRRLTELGSSVMEVVDGLAAAMALISRHGGVPDAAARLAPTALEFVGIETSPFMRRIGQAIHVGTRIAQYDSVAAAADLSGGLLYDRSVTSYAFSTAADAAAFINRFDGAYMNLLISRGESFSTSILGRQATYFSLDELNRELKHPLIHLFGWRAPARVAYRNQGRPVIEGFFFHGPPETMAAFSALCDAIAPLEAFAREKAMRPRPAAALTSDESLSGPPDRRRQEA